MLTATATRIEAPLLWATLPILVAVPIFWRAFGEDSIERTPVMCLVLAGVLMILRLVAEEHPPLAAFVGYAVVHSAIAWWPRYAIEPLAFLVIAGLLYVAAARLEASAERWLVLGLLAGIGVEWVLGVVNLFGVYPSLTGPEATLYVNTPFAQVGQPMGLLRHPNFWSLAMALGAPLAWHWLGWPVAVALLLPGMWATQMTGTVAGLAGLLVMAWSRLRGEPRASAGLAALAAILVVVYRHGFTSSGRLEQWVAAWPMIEHRPVLGNGLGAWYADAILHNARLRREAFSPQAMSEPYQLLYELGAVGVLLGIAVLVWTAIDAQRAGYAWPAESRPWAAMLVVAAVSMFGTTTFHLPLPAFCTIVAAARLRAWAREKGPLHAA